MFKFLMAALLLSTLTITTRASAETTSLDPVTLLEQPCDEDGFKTYEMCMVRTRAVDAGKSVDEFTVSGFRSNKAANIALIIDYRAPADAGAKLFFKNADTNVTWSDMSAPPKVMTMPNDSTYRFIYITHDGGKTYDATIHIVQTGND